MLNTENVRFFITWRLLEGTFQNIDLCYLHVLLGLFWFSIVVSKRLCLRALLHLATLFRYILEALLKKRVLASLICT